MSRHCLRQNERAVALAIICLSCCEGGPAPARAATPSAERRGELVRLVRQDCGSCHGLTLKGGLGKPLLPETLHDREAAGIADVIMDGLAGTPMPPWKGLMTREDALWIAERLKEGFPQ